MYFWRYLLLLLLLFEVSMIRRDWPACPWPLWGRRQTRSVSEEEEEEILPWRVCWSGALSRSSVPRTSAGDTLSWPVPAVSLRLEMIVLVTILSCWMLTSEVGHHVRSWRRSWQGRSRRWSCNWRGHWMSSSRRRSWTRGLSPDWTHPGAVLGEGCVLDLLLLLLPRVAGVVAVRIDPGVSSLREKSIIKIWFDFLLLIFEPREI